MGTNSHINWTEHTYNPWMGCQKVSPGCKNCYMYRDMERYGRDPHKVARTSLATFNAPLKWKEPAKVFTCSWSDFFIEEADEWRDEVWQIIKKTPHLQYQVLTKRPERVFEHLPSDWGYGYPNVWLGVSVERQDYIERAAILLEIPAVIRFLSCEPLLGPLDLSEVFKFTHVIDPTPNGDLLMATGIDWVITGGESGAKTKIREAELDWFRSIRDQCQAHGVAYHHKQNGGSVKIDGEWGGRELDGRTWDEFPETRKAALA